jgi:hypothetical protein
MIPALLIIAVQDLLRYTGAVGLLLSIGMTAASIAADADEASWSREDGFQRRG